MNSVLPSSTRAATDRDITRIGANCAGRTYVRDYPVSSILMNAASRAVPTIRQRLALAIIMFLQQSQEA